jgi:hypothetical protein
MKKLFQGSFNYNVYLSLLCLYVFGLISCKEHNKNTSSSLTEISENTIIHNPIVIEVIDTAGKELHPDSLLSISQRNGLPANSVYRWKNHLAVYGVVNEQENVVSQIRFIYPNTEIKVYQNPFYEFNRKRCGDTTTSKAWNNILLTANLVKDTALQKEYLNYHATQFENWPEVSQGFCNASFQQLLVYKNGRQLMLVISIPKGKSLDELNPKTTENNPRVDEWNDRMKKYQEGISGTKPGEVWVFLKPVKSSM